ncbi:four helix bundle protein [Occallatibacter riparius]|uniref:Four helix bundle protein n=2 Tax=Occallatibacter riparius TaxID=1002689 RepID=A0A9J7BLD1_9BACT|nr:four helix bundle protein [Occallatibacter riparius]
MDLSEAVYKLTVDFPNSELFGLTNQLRRASVSTASNIAEGYGKCTRGEYVQFLGHARGSNFEVQTQLMLPKRLKFGSDQHRQNAERLSDEVSRMLVAIMTKLRK